MAKISLETELAGVRLANPTVLASGILGMGYFNLLRCAHEGAGAVTTKSCNVDGRTGYDNPTVVAWGKDYVLNAVGLSNPGAKEEEEDIREFKKRSKVPMIGSVFGESEAAFAKAAEIIAEAKPDLIEADISCPHAGSAYGKQWSADPAAAAKVTAALKEAVKAPVFIKLSPNTGSMAEMAKAVADAGADGLTCINTAGAMRIDINARKAVLANKVGGLSGPALFPIALRAVYEASRAVELPVIGTGGVTTAEDAVEMLMAGASAVGVGSSITWKGTGIFKEITAGMASWMEKNGYSNLTDLRLSE